MALSKVNYNSMNVTPTASKAIKFNSSNNGLETGDIGGNLVLLATQTASSSATISFTSGIDSTYKEYIFKFTDIHPSANNTSTFFSFQADTGTNTSYNQTITSTHFRAASQESGGSANLSIAADQDQAQGTSFQNLAYAVGGNADESIAGFLHLFDPASTTFVKHFVARCNVYYEGDYSMDSFTSGYFNTTTALTRVQFKMSGGNIEAGTIKMYGIN